jgi:hypothetical protein
MKTFNSPRKLGRHACDPLICVILTSRPLAVDGGLFLRLVSNAVAASVEK